MKRPDWLRRHRDDTPIDAVRYVVLDTELTSLDKRSNRVLSIGAVAMDGTRIRLQEQFYRVVNPGVAVPTPGVLIHGLRPADIENGEPPAQVLSELRAFVEGAVLVGHFARIDLNVLRKELGTIGQTLTNPAICTARIEQWLLRRRPYSENVVHHLDNLDLISIAKRYRLDVQEAHHALQDAFLTARLWQRQIYALQELKVHTLDQLLRAGKVIV